ncbi:hypothetical protein GTR04_0691 [Trichophyton interdigitale]|uniref:Uncharacterized protein n=1 Tax=Trichophyton interdigitale TaxID=101480 RepID=A0A9P5CZ93_9EURO|nr:hypothetical protein GY631_1231 [Trichophyton interdigitale]KAF3899941.1 hypothetical protein GY632_1049 [Trichophyton interdigitale]KAG8211942.1 hypothetical protein GTR04_0691 [Trichophyton interdigitale]
MTQHSEDGQDDDDDDEMKERRRGRGRDEVEEMRLKKSLLEWSAGIVRQPLVGPPGETWNRRKTLRKVDDGTTTQPVLSACQPGEPETAACVPRRMFAPELEVALLPGRLFACCCGRFTEPAGIKQQRRLGRGPRSPYVTRIY